jgi:hypothetical protein
MPRSDDGKGPEGPGHDKREDEIMIRTSIKRAVVTVALVAGVAGGVAATMQPLPTHAAAHTNSIGHWADPGACEGSRCNRPMHVTINSIGHWVETNCQGDDRVAHEEVWGPWKVVGHWVETNCPGDTCIGRTRILRPLPSGRRQPV